MKKLSIVLFLLSFATMVQAQWIVNGFDTVTADSFFVHAPADGAQTGDGSLIFTDITDPVYDGPGALKIDWLVHSTESWGGYSFMNYTVPQEDSTYIDWSGAAALRLWYYNVTPSSKPGQVELRMQIFDAGGSANYWASNADHESWYFNAGTIVYDAAPGWNYLIIPLVDRGAGSPNNEGFSLPGWAGTTNNGTLDLDKIVGYVFEFETPGIADNGQATGTVIFDKLEFLGTAYPAITTFDSTATNGYFNAIDQMEWAGDAGKGAITLTDVTDHPFEGYSSLKYDFTVNNSQSWGGYVNIQHDFADGTFMQDLTSNTDLLLYYKVVTPTTGAANRVTFRFFLYDESSGTSEPWQMTVPIDLYTANTEWQMIKIPLKDLGVGLGTLSTKGFTVPSWNSGNYGDGVLNLDKIAAWKIEFSGSADAPYVQGEICSGSILLDLMSPVGYRETDVTAPNPPEGLLGVAGTYSNLVTWSDVPSESEETYDVYYSFNPITDLTAADVEVAALNVPENTQLAEHILRAPLTDQPVSYYYAVNATDRVGNVGLPVSLSTPITNTAKGVPVIDIDHAPTTTFVADGVLTEWANITPIVMSVTDGSGFIAPNTAIDGDADLKVIAYLAADQQYLYVAFDIEDDVIAVRPESEIASYLSDCPDLFIGLYDWHGEPHGVYRRGATPDYHFRFSKNRGFFDGQSSDSLLLPGTADYFWGEKFPTGYTVEARVSWQDIATKRNAGATTMDDVFVPQRGMRIPIDFSINDNDSPQGPNDREGILCYSPLNDDNSWSTTARWTYTWIGDQWTVGVNDKDVKRLSYELSQNYPNPFNPTTQIRYTLEKPGFVTLKIYDVLGRQVKELVNANQNSGVYNVNFDASGLSSGIYMYQINTEGFQSSKKMMLIK
ncbi:MAG: T9SS C-terminal target domain-containing protein [Ignavibacteriales bacterium]|nr:MAG: T9SS C-terminal target domain-containing protein [Ignavibacteriales bacterium]